jgi:serine/threonine protein kinase
VTDFPPGFDNQQPVAADELGTTYRARQLEPGRDVALRILGLALPARPTRRQFRSSCLAAADMAGHPGVLVLYAVDFTPGHHPYLVTEFPHGSLAQRLATHGPAPVGYTARVGVSLAQTLIAAHGRGVLHQDVRPENVVHTESAGPLLANFGVTRAVAAVGQAELPLECLVHAARELFGWETPGPAADVYGLGSTLYTMLAGQAAYGAEARLGRAALYQRVLRGGPPPIPRGDIPGALADLLSDMMTSDPASRPAMTMAAEALAGYAAEAPAAGMTAPGQVQASGAVPLRSPPGQSPLPVRQPALGSPPLGGQPVPASAGVTSAPSLPPAPPPVPPAPLPPASSPPIIPSPAQRNDTRADPVPSQPHQSASGVVSWETAEAGSAEAEARSVVAQALNPPTQDIQPQSVQPRPTQPPPVAPRPTQPPAVQPWLTQPPPVPPRPTQPPPVQPPAKRRYTGLILLLSAGLVALLAGIVWGAVTAPRAQQHPPAPKITNTSAASPLPAAQQGAYRAGSVTVTPLGHGARVSWTAPRSSNGVAAFIVVAELADQAQQEHTVGARGRSVVFAGLSAGQRYCFVVGTLVESADGRPNTAAASPVCTVVPASAPTSS